MLIGFAQKRQDKVQSHTNLHGFPTSGCASTDFLFKAVSTKYNYTWLIHLHYMIKNEKDFLFSCEYCINNIHYINQRFENEMMASFGVDRKTLYNINLITCELFDLSFKNTSFYNCTFMQCSIQNSSFDKCRFIGCDFLSSIFKNCDLRNATFRGSMLSQKVDAKSIFAPAIIEESLVNPLDGTIISHILLTNSGFDIEKKKYASFVNFLDGFSVLNFIKSDSNLSRWAIEVLKNYIEDLHT